MNTQRSRRGSARSALLAVGLAAVLVGGAQPAASAAPGESYLLIGGTGSSNLEVLRWDDGRLTDIGSSVGIDSGTLSVAVSPNGSFAYVAHTISGTLQGFRVSDDGILTPLPGARLAPGRPVVGAVVSPDGRWLFTTEGSVTNDVHTYAISPEGALTHVASVPIPGATSGLSIPTISPDGRFLFAPSFIGATIDSFAIGADGRLTPAGPQVRTGDRPALPSVTPDGEFLYITNEGTNDISGFRISPTGALSPIGRYPTKDVPHGVAITPDGRYLYTPQTLGMAIAGFAIQGDGTLLPLPGAAVASPSGHLPGRVVLSPDAQWLYAIDTLTTGGTGKVFSYRVQPDGSLVPSGEAPVDSGVTFSDGATGVFATPA